MWGRLKGQVTNLRPRGEKDVDENDTIVSRALLRYYEPQVPAWLVPPGGMPQTALEPEKSASPPLPQAYARRPSVDPHSHIFDRMERRDSTASTTTVSPAASKPASGLASRLKNSKW